MPDDPLQPRNDYIDTDDLFSKLDQLISRHQGKPVADPQPSRVPTLMEAVEPKGAPGEPEIPVLHDVVETREEAAEPGTSQALSESRIRQLQVALYLRLRQRLDRELDGEAFAFVPPHQLARITQALRGALSEVVRDSVEQVLVGPDISSR
jgi:hypothetical protein